MVIAVLEMNDYAVELDRSPADPQLDGSKAAVCIDRNQVVIAVSIDPGLSKEHPPSVVAPVIGRSLRV
jgi:hypothetical protein